MGLELIRIFLRKLIIIQKTMILKLVLLKIKIMHITKHIKMNEIHFCKKSLLKRQLQNRFCND